MDLATNSEDDKLLPLAIEHRRSTVNGRSSATSSTPVGAVSVSPGKRRRSASVRDVSFDAGRFSSNRSDHLINKIDENSSNIDPNWLTLNYHISIGKLQTTKINSAINIPC